MAKVLISIPDALLGRLDAYAKEHGETRSGFLRRVAERELEAGGDLRRRDLEAILGPPVALGVDAARLIREDRESH